MSVSRRQEEIEARAAEWVIRLGGAPLRDDERRAIDLWLAESPAHGAAFRHAQSTWAALGALEAAPDLMPPPSIRWRLPPVARMAAAAMLLLGLGGGAFWFGNPLTMLRADYRTLPGETRTVTLPDGSTAQLDTASALKVRFNGRERLVELMSGEAYFTVAPVRGAETRPFVVAAANGTAKALGTQFMVEREGEGAEVTVAEHLVRVVAAGPDAEGAGMVVLSPGQSVRYDRATGLGAVTQADLNQAAAWRQGRLVFDNVSLADVAVVLNRYRRGRIVITDPALAGRRVSGVFEIADLQGALASITRELGARAVSVPPFVTLLY